MNNHLEQAADWRRRIHADPRLALSDDYAAWLSHDANRHAMQDMQPAWDVLADHCGDDRVMALRQAALARARKTRRFDLRGLLKVAAAVVIVAAVGAIVSIVLTRPVTYATAIGERRVVTLDDGSTLSLDSDTAVEVRYHRDARALTLAHGRARFDVTRDPVRPFTVTAGGETVTAIGTSFNVERIGEAVMVTLLEGQVVVSPIAAPKVENPTPRPPVSLAAGQRLVVKNDKPALAPANLQVAVAWESGTLVFNDEPLAECVSRVNRYAATPLRVDPALAELRITGVFKAGDIESFVDAVTAYFPVDAVGGTALRPRT